MALVYKTKYAAAVNTRNLFSNKARSIVGGEKKKDVFYLVVKSQRA